MRPPRPGAPATLRPRRVGHRAHGCAFLALLREDGADRRFGVRIPPDAAIALLITLELLPGTTAADAFDEIGRAREPAAPDTPLTRFCRVLDAAGVLDAVEIAVPGDRARAAQLARAARSGSGGGQRARRAREAATVDPRIAKTAADMIVPFDRSTS